VEVLSRPLFNNFIVTYNLVPPVMEKKETEQLTIREGQALGLTCPVKSSFDKNGSLDLAITWSHDGRPLDKTMKNVEVN
jgi:hypothetical protein